MAPDYSTPVRERFHETHRPKSGFSNGLRCSKMRKVHVTGSTQCRMRNTASRRRRSAFARWMQELAKPSSAVDGPANDIPANKCFMRGAATLLAFVCPDEVAVPLGSINDEMFFYVSCRLPPLVSSSPVAPTASGGLSTKPPQLLGSKLMAGRNRPKETGFRRAGRGKLRPVFDRIVLAHKKIGHSRQWSGAILSREHACRRPRCQRHPSKTFPVAQRLRQRLEPPAFCALPAHQLGRSPQRGNTSRPA